MKNLKIIFAIIILIVTTVFVYAEEETKQVEATGYATIENNDISKAREEALNNAKIEALEMVCGVFIRANSTAKDYDIASKTIESYTNGYIKNFNITDDKQQNPKTYFVSIKAEVVIKNIGEKTADGKFYIQDGVLTFYVGNDTEVTVPNNVVAIGFEAFQDCDSVQHVILPEGLKYIEARAFRKCDNLRKINLPNSLISLGNRSFSGCEKLSGIKLPDSLEKLDVGTFIECKNIQSISFPDKIKEIPDVCFYNCDKLETVFLNKVEIIGYKAFWKTCIVNITLPDNIKLNAYSFSDCQLRSITIPTGVKVIPYACFVNNPLYEINIGKDVEEIEGFAFAKASHEIGEKAPNVLNKVEKIIIPENVRKIKQNAFQGFSLLKEITIPENCSIDPLCTFADCESLNKIIINGKFEVMNNLSVQDWATFDSCRNLKYLEINTELIEGIEIPPVETLILKEWKTMNKNSINNNKIKTLKIDNIDTLEEDGIFLCDNLETVTIGNIKTMKINCIRFCDKLKSITINDIETMGVGCINGITNLESITIGNVGTMKEKCIHQNQKLNSIKIGNADTIEENAIYQNESLKLFEADKIKKQNNPIIIQKSDLNVKIHKRG